MRMPLFFIHKSGFCFLLLLFFTGACTPQPSPIQETVTPTNLPAPVETQPLERTPTASDTPVPPTMFRNALPPKDYIFYYKGGDVWAINPLDGKPLLFLSDIHLGGRSPDNKQMLLTDFETIYLANLDGSTPRRIFELDYEKYPKGLSFGWFTENELLLEAYEDEPGLIPPDLYKLNIHSGEMTQLIDNNVTITDRWQRLIAILSGDKTWVKEIYPPGTVQLVAENGNANNFFDPLMIGTEMSGGNYFPIQYIKRLDMYAFLAAQKHNDGYRLWLGSKQTPPYILFQPDDGNIDDFAVSPDERYLALTCDCVNGSYIFVFDLNMPENKQALYRWDFPNKLGTKRFIWGPDSLSIAFDYIENKTNPDGTNRIDTGIQVMNILTGEVKLILIDNDITNIIDWHSIK